MSKSVDINQQIERDERAMERIASALERLARVEENKFRADHPKPKAKRPAEIMRLSDDKRDQFSDRPDQNWVEETEQTASRFRNRLESPKIGSNPAQAGSSVADEGQHGADKAVPSADTNLRNSGERSSGD